MKKIYIANRGEIRRRIAETAKKMGLETACIRDQNQPIEHRLVGLIDDYVFVENESTALYLDEDQQIKYAQQAGADAIHPGFGFLSENVGFANKVKGQGLIWIGPAPKCIDQMADKSSASKIAQDAGVPVLPVYRNFEPSKKDSMAKLVAFTQQHEFPFIIKAALGGGGKGMRVVHSVDELAANIERASSEALNAFGNGRVLVEKYLESPRHVETQLVADKHGNYFVVGDRDCSAQRRYQKVIEESPAPDIQPDLRKSMHQTSISLGKKIGYDSVGTIEFLVHGKGKKQSFYFLEMNTRLQVEHPVTEEVFGIDLIEQQIKAASNQKILDLPQEPYGHSIEARVYAEDPKANFIPQPGLIEYFRPFLGAGVRWETTLNTSDVISASYDPMIAKVVVWAKSRELAMDKLSLVLEQTILFGVQSNKEFLLKLIQLKDFREMNLSTHMIKKNIDELTDDSISSGSIFVKNVDVLSSEMKTAQLALLGEKASTSVDVIQSAFNQNSKSTSHIGADTRIQLQQKNIIHDKGGILATVLIGEILSDKSKMFFVGVDHKKYIKIIMESSGREFHAWREKKLQRTKRAASGSLSAQEGVQAPVPGVVRAVKTKSGDSVTEGQILFIIESMKMEFEIKSTSTSVVDKVLVSEGNQVDADEMLASFKK